LGLEPEPELPPLKELDTLRSLSLLDEDFTLGISDPLFPAVDGEFAADFSADMLGLPDPPDDWCLGDEVPWCLGLLVE
jgi:hypothetical protein